MDDGHGCAMRIVQWILFALISQTQSQFIADPCSHFVYCTGGDHRSILHVVQTAKIYNDSKTFVDQPLKYPKDVIVANFDAMMTKTRGKPDKPTVRQFVDENFEEVGTELHRWEPTDWTTDPEFLKSITDKEFQAFGRDLHDKWKDLGRKVKTVVRDNPERYSEIYMEHPFIVPGGRFREMYYWDSYWTIIGLLISGMTESVKGMLLNFVHLIDSYGHILNGNRVYYINRSQPPLFISMVEKYYKATHDEDFLKNNIMALDKEFQFWTDNRMVDVLHNGKVFRLARYSVNVGTPRPESYWPDYEKASFFASEEEKKEFYKNMRSGAESGWDYSSKWFIKDKSNVGVLTDTKTSQIIPVELNSYLCKNARILSDFYQILGNSQKSRHYKAVHESFKKAIESVLWNKSSGSWFDYDLINQSPRLYFYPSTIAPLWAECYTETKQREKTKKVLQYLKNNPAMKYEGGIPTSNIKTGQQWDLSNAWAPLQELMITGLSNIGTQEADKMAKDIAWKWFYNNWLSYKNNNHSMFEKYDVELVGEAGRGGEYGVQQGFGWTNGVALQILQKYGHEFSSAGVSPAIGPPRLSTYVAGPIFVLHILFFFHCQK